MDPGREPPLLFLVTHREPVLDQMDPIVDELPLEDRALLEEPPMLLGGAESEDLLDPGPVVPAPVEQDDLSAGRQLLDVPLEIPLRPLTLGGDREGDDAGDP